MHCPDQGQCHKTGSMTPAVRCSVRCHLQDAGEADALMAAGLSKVQRPGHVRRATVILAACMGTSRQMGGNTVGACLLQLRLVRMPNSDAQRMHNKRHQLPRYRAN